MSDSIFEQNRRAAFFVKPWYRWHWAWRTPFMVGTLTWRATGREWRVYNLGWICVWRDML